MVVITTSAMLKSVFITFISLLPCIVLPAQQPSVFATVKNGKLEGYRDEKTNLNIFLGVPFAQPPVGELRWKAPQPLPDWKGTRTAKKFGSRPVQTNVFGDMIYRSDTMSEDCLYLNIWVPRKQSHPLPVLVYFYGGGFVAGESSEPRYDGAAMAQKGIITITVNYRLNIFGFFAHPELSREPVTKHQAITGYWISRRHYNGYRTILQPLAATLTVLLLRGNPQVPSL